jgi:tRNA (adenine22-N1)-methyltransferase
MPIKLENKRLMTCAELLKNGGNGKNREKRIAADIGTDHGYLACYLVESGICEKAVAADINTLPLKSAEKTVKEHALGDKISLVLSDGLDNVSQDGITDIICAGMGGELIVQIISRCTWAKNCTLILQPMTKADELRRWLYENGFAVKEERACRDGKFAYAIIRAEYDPNAIDYPCSERYLAVGRIRPDSPDARLRRAGNGMLKSPDKCSEGKRLVRLADELTAEIKGDLA